MLRLTENNKIGVARFPPCLEFEKRETGTSIRFWPDAKYFDSVKFSIPELVNNLRAKAVLCPGLTITLYDEKSNNRHEWYYEDGIKDYLLEQFILM